MKDRASPNRKEERRGGTGKQRRGADSGTRLAKSQFVGIDDTKVEEAEVAHGAGRGTDVERIARSDKNNPQAVGFGVRRQGRRVYSRGGLAGSQLAWAARRNIDCGRVVESLPAWPEIPAFAWACWRGRVRSVRDPDLVWVILQSVTGASGSRGATLWTVWRRSIGPAGGSEWQLRWKPGSMMRQS